MLESVLFGAGFALVLVGTLSFLYPLRWLGIGTRGIAVLVISGGFLLIAIAADLIVSYLVYLGLTLFFTGLVSLIRPLRFPYIRTRRSAFMVLGFGLLLAAGSLLLPYPDNEATNRVTKLDDWMPRWQVRERHALQIAAAPDRVFAAIHEVRADEIPLFRTLTAIRRCGGTGPESILNAPEQKPLLDVATQTTFLLLANEAPREIVVGTVIAAPRAERAAGKLTPEVFRTNLSPGLVLATMNFLVRPDEGGGSTVSTETRIYANSSSALRRFVVYWRLIHPGSDLIRRMWLRAIAQRAEGREPRMQ
jgi:hypothetical protein